MVLCGAWCDLWGVQACLVPLACTSICGVTLVGATSSVCAMTRHERITHSLCHRQSSRSRRPEKQPTSPTDKRRRSPTAGMVASRRMHLTAPPASGGAHARNETSSPAGARRAHLALRLPKIPVTSPEARCVSSTQPTESNGMTTSNTYNLASE